MEGLVDDIESYHVKVVRRERMVLTSVQVKKNEKNIFHDFFAEFSF